MLMRKLLRTMKLYSIQFISMIIMIAIGIGIFVGFNMEWVCIDENTSSFLKATNFADYRVVADSDEVLGFDEDDLEAIEDIDGVDKATRYLSVNVDVKGSDGDSVALTVTENPDVSGCMVMSGDEYDEDSEDGIWLSDKYAKNNDVEIGDDLAFVYKDVKIKGEVVGLIKSGEQMICVRDESQLMPDYETHGFAYISPEMYEDAMGMAVYPQINVLSALDKDAFTDAADEALDETTLILTKDESISYSGAQGEIDEGKTMGSLLPVLFLLIAVLTMVTTMHRITAHEKTQIGTLKALGFKDRRILRHYTSYAAMIGIIGCAAGIAIGFVIARTVMNPKGMMGTYLDMPDWGLSMPWFCYPILAGILVFLTLIGNLSVRRIMKGTSAEVLRPYTPRNMKPLVIERLHIFDRASFGTRWNMRDAARHKARTLMSLIGVFGCVVILVGVLGMRDTMDGFIETYYNGAANYASKISVAEEATEKEREDLADEYDGDWSGSVSVQIEDKAVSLDIYDTEHDRVRFPSEDKGYTEIEDDGAYICVRLADEYDLTEGDTFIISPYGTDDEYKLRLNGVVRSVSENIIISPEYAEEKDIDYVIDSIYTDEDKSEITEDSTVKSVQSKGTLMDSFDQFMEIMNLMIIIMILGAAVLGVVVLYNLGTMSYTERYREMATLKVVGFKDRKIGRLLMGQNLWIAIIGIILGFPGGIIVLYWLIKLLASEYEMSIVVGPLTCIGSVAMALVISVAVSLMVANKNKKIDMVEALKGAE